MGVDHATPGILILVILISGFVLGAIRSARLGREFFVRRIAGIDAIEQSVGRAAEQGRPVSFSSGLTSVGPVLYAIMGVLHAVTRRAARLKTRLLLPQNDPQVLAITDDIARDAYRVEGRAESYDPRSLIFLSEEQFAFAAGYVGMMQRENVGSAFLFGIFAGESLILSEAGQRVGASQVAASVTPEQVAFFVCTCDYTLIGEELFAASAYLTREPIQLGSLFGQDLVKLFFFVVILVGVGVATLNGFIGAEPWNLDALMLAPW